MTPREFFNAWMGWAEHRNEQFEARRNVVFGAARYNAVSTAFSKKQGDAIARDRFDWEKKKSTTPMSAKQITGLLNFISKDGSRA